jgi:hypothetical protein
MGVVPPWRRRRHGVFPAFRDCPGCGRHARSGGENRSCTMERPRDWRHASRRCRLRSCAGMRTAKRPLAPISARPDSDALTVQLNGWRTSASEPMPMFRRKPSILSARALESVTMITCLEARSILATTRLFDDQPNSSASKRKPAGPPMTLGNMRKLGVGGLTAASLIACPVEAFSSWSAEKQ